MAAIMLRNDPAFVEIMLAARGIGCYCCQVNWHFKAEGPARPAHPMICDRASDMVISGGVNIYPSEIEHVLTGMPGVLDCVIFGIPDEEYGEAPAAQVAASPDSGLDSDAVRHYLRERIAGYKVPRRIEIVASLPRDDNGKIARRKIRDAYWQGSRRRI